MVKNQQARSTEGGAVSTENRTLIIRADANTRIGTGHLMRCLALAQAWQEHGGKAVFITACNSSALKQRLRNEGFDVVELQCAHPDPADLKTTMSVLAAHPEAWLVLDGYHFDSTYQRLVKEAGHRLLVIDDMAHLDRYYADIVLNQNIHAHKLHYICEPYTRLLLGTKYVLLRREFWPWRNYKREVPEVAKKVLVTMGGSDPDNITLKVIRALAQIDIPDLEAVVVVGPSNLHRETLHRAAESSPLSISLIENAANMPELMAWADIAISAGGTTVWELLFLGVPTLTLPIANNQREITRVLNEWGFVESLKGLNWFQDAIGIDVGRLIYERLQRIILDNDIRILLSLRGRQLVDGCGVLRIANVLLGQAVEDIHLRPVFPEDCSLLWEWANDPVVRTCSFSSEPIPWIQHLKWFQSRRKDPNTVHFIATNEESCPIGQVRFDIHGTEAEISLSLCESFRGRGFGTKLIRLAVGELFRITPSVVTVHAYVKPTNQASIRAFEKAGFKIHGVEVVRGGHVAIHLSLAIDNNVTH
ncbi:UDP-2,4-diacetamido-2,4,6-trideoxy-beta-L-altropyranose hydrolase [Moorella sp. E306M]|uniref:UDP-2,4-diacetamido-2,4, 6-trideoxy-beta-L-altropyranose hydrolase n=1 Tax=Moorella sp. E306M TaxID=2572683 RepID=UPI0027D94770|nr:UDP-2,4-diacetamido-2,4,6-trideoxy-beta-L-altropyranose hydrolase [Moorella sp. E306M]